MRHFSSPTFASHSFVARPRGSLDSRNPFSYLNLPILLDPLLGVNAISLSDTQELPPAIHTFDLGNEKPMTFRATLQGKINASTMIDSGAPTSFIDENFVKIHKLTPRKKSHPEIVRVVDGRQSSSGEITHEIDLHLQIGQHKEILTFQITKIARYHTILGKSWLPKHDPRIKWSDDTLQFDPIFCRKNCYINSDQPGRDSPQELVKPSSSLSSSPLSSSLSKAPHSSPLFAPVNPRSWKEPNTLRRVILENPNPRGQEKCSVSIVNVSEESDKPQKSELEEMSDLQNRVPSQFHESLSVFSSKEAELPPHRYIDHAIPINSDQKLTLGPLYSMSNAELGTRSSQNI